MFLSSLVFTFSAILGTLLVGHGKQQWASLRVKLVPLQRFSGSYAFNYVMDVEFANVDRFFKTWQNHSAADRELELGNTLTVKVSRQGG